MADQEGEIMVLHDHITHEFFVRVARGQGWQLRQTQEGDGERVAFQEIWTTADGKGVINFIDDPVLGCRRVWIRGPRQTLKELHFECSSRLPAWEQGELLDHVAEATDHNESVDAIFRLAAGFLRPHPAVIEQFEIYLQAPYPTLREATLQAIAYRMWPESVGLLERAAASDEDESVRAFAQNLLDQRLDQ